MHTCSGEGRIPAQESVTPNAVLPTTPGPLVESHSTHKRYLPTVSPQGQAVTVTAKDPGVLAHALGHHTLSEAFPKAGDVTTRQDGRPSPLSGSSWSLEGSGQARGHYGV